MKHAARDAQMVCIYVASLTHPDLSDLLLRHREFVARQLCEEMCGILIKTASTVLLFQRSCSLQISPGQEFETENVFMCRKACLYGIPTAIRAA